MKFLIVLAFFAVARAELFEKLIYNEIDAAVEAVHATEHAHISLCDLEDEDRQLLVRELQTDIANTLAEKLGNVTDKLINAISTGKSNINALFTSFRQLVNDLKELGGKAAGHVKVAIAELKNKISTLKTDHLSPAVKLVVDFIKTFFKGTEDSLVLYDEVAEEVVAEVVTRALARRGIIGDIGRGLLDKAKDIINNLLYGLHGKFKELGQFMLELTKAHVEAAKPHVENIKTLAKEFIGHAKEATLQTLNESLEFFRGYKNDLGGLWTQLKESVAKVKSHLTPKPSTAY